MKKIIISTFLILLTFISFAFAAKPMKDDNDNEICIQNDSWGKIQYSYFLDGKQNIGNLKHRERAEIDIKKYEQLDGLEIYHREWWRYWRKISDDNGNTRFTVPANKNVTVSEKGHFQWFQWFFPKKTTAKITNDLCQSQTSHMRH